MSLRIGPMSGFRGGLPPVVPPFRTITINNQTELNNALASLQPRDVLNLVKNVTPYDIDVTGLAPVEEVTIQSADSGDWAKLRRVRMTSCQKFVFKYFYFSEAPVAFGGTELQYFDLYLCSDITVIGVYADGGASAFYNTGVNRGNSFAMINTCSRVLFDGEAETGDFDAPGQVENCYWGIRARHSSDVTIRKYRIRKIQGDSIQFGGNMRDVVVEYNKVGEVLGAIYSQNHQDGIQGFLTGATGDVENVRIENNVIAELGSYAGQGIFFSAEENFTYRNVTIARNFVQCRRNNGITFRHCAIGLVEENLLMESINSADSGGGVATPGIQTITGLPIANSGVVVRNNLAPTYFNIPSTGVTASGNVTSSERNSIIPGIDSMTTLEQLEAVTMPAGLGPIDMR